MSCVKLHNWFLHKVYIAVFSQCSSFGSVNATPCTQLYSSFYNMSDSEETRANQLDPSIGAAIQSTISESISALTDNLTKPYLDRAFFGHLPGYRATGQAGADLAPPS